MEAGGVTGLHEDRYFDSDPIIRRHARTLYEETRGLPIVSPHGHIDAAMLANNDAFGDPTSLMVTSDHYIVRMLYSRGVSLESLGIEPIDGTRLTAQSDPRKIWQTFADNWHLFRGTPTRAWLDYQLHEVFGINRPFNSASAQNAYDSIVERLESVEFLPRALLRRFNVEILATTDAPTDTLDHHNTLQQANIGTRIIPTFRPDKLFHIASAGWIDELDRFERAIGASIHSCADFVEALARRRREFKSVGGTATDHGVLLPRAERLPETDADSLFSKARQRKATAVDQEHFEAHLLMEMARLSTEDGLVMQLHPGAFRNHNQLIHRRFGADRGADIPVATEFTRNLRSLLGTYGSDPRFQLIVFTLDETTYSRELAPLAGHYPAMLLGAPWWFHDSIEGMTRFRQQTTETAGFENLAGFTDDARTFCSIPARHDLARRVDANYLGGLVARHIIEMTEAREIARALAYDLAKRAYRLT
jgi:glucuronate isomerase